MGDVHEAGKQLRFSAEAVGLNESATEGAFKKFTVRASVDGIEALFRVF